MSVSVRKTEWCTTSCATVITVDLCTDCPFVYSETYSLCQHPGIDNEDVGELTPDVAWNGPPPEWCPLRTSAAVVRLEVNP